MEDFLTLLSLVVLGVMVLMPILVMQLFSRQRELRERVATLEEEVRLLAKCQVSSRNAPAKETVVATPAAPPQDKRTMSDAGVASVPALPNGETKAETEAPGLQISPPTLPATALVAESQPVELEDIGESQLGLLLDKVGLKPPAANDENSNAMAWWSTRIGLALGVIAAVFLGMYVNQDTVPWVRLLQLASTAVGVFAGGLFLERKVPAFGRALSAGGLGLLFVAAFAAYGLPAMKVIGSPMVGAVVQLVVLALIAGWSLWRNREAVFGLSLGLGYVTCWFSVAEGLPLVSLIALVLLSAVGSLMFASKGWWSGLWGAVLGSGLGFALQALSTWSGEVGPSYPQVLAMALSLTLLPLVALSRQWLRGEQRIRRVVPLVTTIGLATSLAAVGMREFDLVAFYLAFAVLLFGAGWWWRRDETEGIWQTLWAKAMVLVALFLITQFEGPTRAFSLLAQAGALVWLGRSRRRPVFEIGALIAYGVGALLLFIELNPRPLEGWLAEEWAFISYLFCGELLLFGYRRLVVTEPGSGRGSAALLCSIALTTALLPAALWMMDHALAPLVAWVFGGLVLAIASRESRLHGVWSPLFTLLATLGWLMVRGNVDASSTWWMVAWLALAACYYVWLAKNEAMPIVLARTGLLWVSLFAVYAIARDWVGYDWVAPVFFAVALVWALLGYFLKQKDFALSSLLPASIGTLLLLPTLFSISQSDAVGVVFTLSSVLAILWWGMSWRNRERYRETPAFEFAFTALLGIVIWLSLHDALQDESLAVVLMMVSSLALVAWRFLRADSLTWLAASYALGAGVMVVALAGSSDAPVWMILMVALLATGNGVWLSRPCSRVGLLARPKVASIFWGALAMLTVLGGFGLGGAANWTTAAWATGAVALLVCGFWAGLRGYRMIALAALLMTIARLFLVDIDNTLWRILAFGVTGGLLLGIGFLYSRFHNRLAEGDLDWGADRDGVPQDEAIAAERED